MLVLFSLLMAALIVLADQMTKIVAVLTLKGKQDVVVIEGLLEWTYRENTGAAFSMLSDHREVFLISTTVLLVLCMALLLHRFSKKPYWCLVMALLLGGGVGNMIDRLALGYVVDYIHVLFFPAVFNFADICVSVGSVLFAIPILVDVVRDVVKWFRERKTAPADASDAGDAQ